MCLYIVCASICRIEGNTKYFYRVNLVCIRIRDRVGDLRWEEDRDGYALPFPYILCAIFSNNSNSYIAIYIHAILDLGFHISDRVGEAPYLFACLPSMLTLDF
jgi:hypothetical protein